MILFKPTKVLPLCQVSHFFHTSSQAVSYCQDGKSVPCFCFLRSTISVRGVLISFVIFYRRAGSKDKAALPLGLCSSNGPLWCHSNLSLGILQSNWNESEASILTRQQWPNRHIPQALSGEQAVHASCWDKNLETPLGKAPCPPKKSPQTPTPPRALRAHSPGCLTASSPHQSGASHHLQLLRC